MAGNKTRGYLVRRTSIFTALLPLVVLSGCTTPMVRSVPLGSASSLPHGSGISYYLPMRYARVTFERTKLESSAVQALAKAEQAASEARQAETVAKRSVELADALLKQLKADGVAESSAAYQAALGELSKARVDNAAKARLRVTAEAALTAALQLKSAFDRAQGMCGYVDAFKVELLDPVPDTAERYLLTFSGNPLRHDTLDFKTTASGLLSTADGIAADQTAEVLVNLARSIVAAPIADVEMRTNLLSEHPFFKRDKDAAAPPVPPPCEDGDWRPLQLSMVLDPTRAEGWKDFSCQVSRAATVRLIADNSKTVAEFRYVLSLEGSEPPEACHCDCTTLGSSNPATTEQQETSAPQIANERKVSESEVSESAERPLDGVLYRRERPLLVNVQRDSTPISTFVLTVPNRHPAELISVDATTFARNETKLGFQNGMLTSVHADRPSPALEVVSVPWKIAKATVGIVGEIFKLRVDYRTNQRDAVTRETELLNQMRALIQAETALEAARRAAANPAPTPETPAQADPPGE